MKQQNGAALVVVLSMLTMSLMLGLSGMQSSLVEERLAGNYKAATEAQMAAEYAVSQHIATIRSGRNFSEDDFTTFSSIAEPDVETDGEPCVGLPPKVQCWFVAGQLTGQEVYFVKGRGEVDGMEASHEVVAIIDPSGVGFLGLSPKTIPSPIEFFRPVSSQASYEGTKEEELYGRSNAAISTADQSSARSIIDAILKNNDPEPDLVDGVYLPPDGACDSGNGYRLCNYQGGVGNPISEPILGGDKLEAFDAFIGMVYDEATKIDHLDGAVEGVNFLTTREGYDAREGTEVDGEYFPPDRPVFEGSLEGSGILVVDGNMEFRGDPGFDGVVVVLGDYSVSGGGGSDFNGAIITSKYSRRPGEGDLDYDPVSIDISGGGGNDYRYDRAALNAAFHLLSEAARDLWNTENGQEKDTLIFEGNFIGAWYEVE